MIHTLFMYLDTMSFKSVIFALHHVFVIKKAATSVNKILLDRSTIEMNRTFMIVHALQTFWNSRPPSADVLMEPCIV